MQQAGSTNHRIICGVAALAALGLLPFTIRHAVSGAWYLTAIIGGLNVILAAGSVWLYWHRHDTASIRLAAYVLVGLANVVAILSIQAQGGPTAYWIFPIVFANFYLLPFAAGTIMSIAFATLSLLAVGPSVPSDYFMRLLVTTPLCIFFGVVFSRGMTRQRRQLEYLAGHDALTGAGNRHSMEGALNEAVARKDRYGERCSLVILDLDHFKAINDGIGHLRADEIIVELTKLLSNRIRVVDRLYRFGGEEFVLLLPHAGARACWQLAEALRMEVDEHLFGDNLPITISAGIAELETGETAEDWLRRADEALYRAKEEGRNRVVAGRPAGKGPGASGDLAPRGAGSTHYRITNPHPLYGDQPS